MAFCQKCGQQMNDADVKCPNCGEPNSANTSASKNVNEIINKAKSFNPKSIGIIVAGIVVVVLIISLLSAIFTPGYEKAVNNYIDVICEANVKKIDKLAPKEVWEYFEDELDMDLDDYKDEAEESLEDMLEEQEDEYGKRIRVSYKIEDKEKMDKDDLKEIKDSLKDSYGIKKNDVKKAYELELEMTIKGSEDKDTEDVDLTAVKIGSKWYILEAMQSLYWLG